jgi:hypothetical protein
MLEWLPAALPISVGPRGLELIRLDAEGARLTFFGLERFRRDPERPAWSVETGFGVVDDPRFDDAARAWVTVVREVFEHAATWPRGSDRWLGPLDLVATHHFQKVLKPKPRRTEAQFVAAWRELFAPLLPPRAELVAAVEVLDGELRGQPSIADVDEGRGRVALEVVPDSSVASVREHRGVVTLRLIVWDGGGLRDVKEQECTVLEGGALDAERVRAWLSAWREVAALRLAALGDEVDTHLPFGVVPDGVLELARPTTRDDFEAAMKKRWRL